MKLITASLHNAAGSFYICVQRSNMGAPLELLQYRTDKGKGQPDPGDP